MKQLASMAILTWLLTSVLSAQDWGIEFNEFTLKNGLHVILHKDTSTPIVAVTVMYHVGSKNEDPEQTGFAHFFEHLMFEGSKYVKRGEFDRYVMGAGGTNNAKTSFDFTYYHEVFPSNYLGLGLWLESERMLHARIDPIGVDTQREVVKEERRQTVDNSPYGLILEETLKRAFTKHPYRWPIIGSLEHLDRATLADFEDFYKTFYVPENAVLSIAGDINIRKTKRLVKRYFKAIPRGTKPVPRPSIIEPEQQSEVRGTVYDNITLPAVIMAYKIPALGAMDYYPLSMLLRLLSDGDSSRLTKSVTHRQQKALFTGAISLEQEDPGLSLFYGIANAGVTVDALEHAIDEEIRKVKAELISEREHQKLLNQIESERIAANGSLLGIAESLATYHMFFGDAKLINTEIDRYRKVTREDLQRVAKQYLRKEKRVVLHYLPKTEQPQEEREG